MRAGRGGDDYEWVIFDFATRASVAFALDTQGLPRLSLHGSITRDNDGRL